MFSLCQLPVTSWSTSPGSLGADRSSLPTSLKWDFPASTLRKRGKVTCSFDGTHALSTRDDPIPSMIFRFPARSRSGPFHFFRFPVRSFSGFLPGRVPFFLLCVWSVLLFPFAPLVDYLCVIQLREISPCVLPMPVSPYSYVWSSLDSKGAVS